MERILISEVMDEAAVERLKAAYAVEYRPSLVDDAIALEAALPAADAWIVRNRTQVRGRLLEAATKVRVVGRLGVGLDNIDVAACDARGIRVIPATGANADSVAEYVMAMATVLLRGLVFATEATGAGRWMREAMSGGRELGGKTIGIVGFGSIGRVVARKAGALGMRIVAHDPQLAPADPAWAAHAATPLTLDALLEASDVVTLHVPLLPGTRGLLDAGRLARLRPDAVLINAARGGIVDETALAALLRAGRLAGAALDVFATEPLPAGSALVGAPRLILTPHVAGVTREANERVGAVVAEGVARALRESR